MTTTSGDRHGWSGAESWRDGALTDSQHFSQEHSQQHSQEKKFRGFLWGRHGATHRTTHSNTHSNTHRPRSQPCECEGPVRPRIGKGYASRRNIVLVTWRSELHHVPPPLDTLDFRAIVRMPTSLTCEFVFASCGYRQVYRVSFSVVIKTALCTLRRGGTPPPPSAPATRCGFR
jgi:hypothetical protein